MMWWQKRNSWIWDSWQFSWNRSRRHPQKQIVAFPDDGSTSAIAVPALLLTSFGDDKLRNLRDLRIKARSVGEDQECVFLKQPAIKTVDFRSQDSYKSGVPLVTSLSFQSGLDHSCGE